MGAQAVGVARRGMAVVTLVGALALAQAATGQGGRSIAIRGAILPLGASLKDVDDGWISEDGEI